MEKINVEQIMEEIREDIRKKGYTDEMLSFHEVGHAENESYRYEKYEYLAVVSEMNANWNVPWYFDLQQGGVKGFFKKVIRKLVTFLVAPISVNQNQFNSEVTRGFEQLAGYIGHQDQLLEQYRRDIQLLEEKIAKLEQEQKSISK